MKKRAVLFAISSIMILGLAGIPVFATTLLAPVYPGAVADPVANAQSQAAMVYYSCLTLHGNGVVRATARKRE